VQAALDKIQDRNGPFVWKNSYVWCYNFVQDFTVAHPIYPDDKGKKQSDSKDIKCNTLASSCDMR
jgi:phage-related protein